MSIESEVMALWSDWKSKCYHLSGDKLFYSLPPNLQKQTKPKECKEWVKNSTEHQNYKDWKEQKQNLNRVCNFIEKREKVVKEKKRMDYLNSEAYKQEKQRQRDEYEHFHETMNRVLNKFPELRPKENSYYENFQWLR